MLFSCVAFGQYKTRDSIKVVDNKIEQAEQRVNTTISNQSVYFSNRESEYLLNAGVYGDSADIIGYDQSGMSIGQPTSRPFDYFLQRSQLYQALLAEIQLIKDSLNALSAFVWGSGGVPSYTPVYTLNYSPTQQFYNTTLTEDSTKTLYIKNTGTGQLKITAIIYEAINTDRTLAFSYQLLNRVNGARQDTIWAGDSLKLNITYTPYDFGNEDAWRLLITSNGGAQDTINLYGSGQPAITPSMIIYMPADLTTSGDSLGTLAELQAKIDNDEILPGASIRFEKGGVWTVRGTDSCGLNLTSLSGTADSFIIFESYGTGTNKPRFDFTGTNDMFEIHNAKYLRFDGLAWWNSGTWSRTTSPRFAIACMDARTTSDTIKYIEINNCLINNVGGGFYINSNAMVRNISFLKDSIINTRNVPAIGSGDGQGCGINIRRYNSVGYQDTVTVDSCVFVNNGGSGDTGGNEHGIYFGASNKNLTVTNSTFSESPTNGGGGVTLAGGSNITIANNTFTNLVKGVIITPAQANSGRIDSVFVYNNSFTSTSSSSYAGVDINALTAYTNNLTNYVKIYNNLFYNLNTAAGVNVENIDSLSNVLIANNSFINCYGSVGAFRHKYSRPNYASNNRILNNIFFNNVNDAPLLYFQGKGISDVQSDWTTINYNLYYKTAGTTYFNVNETKYTSVAGFVTASPYEDNGVLSNPLFVDVDNRDYRLSITSPKDNGTNLTSDGITTDFEGDGRPYNTVFDIGYDEYEP